MRFSILTIVSAIAATVVMAAPQLTKRDAASDLGVLNYALTLEHLEAEFYEQGLAKFGASAFKKVYHGRGKQVRQRFVHIGEHESTHVNTLISVITSLGGTPVEKCKYKFPLDTVEQFVAVAQALENTGVSAYLGAASGLSGDLLTAAATITTVEARHSSYLNELLWQKGAPYSFDTPLTPREIVTIAINFIESCPQEVGVVPFTQLTATMPGHGESTVHVAYEGQEAHGDNAYCQFWYDNKVAVSKRSECTWPKDACGYVYLVVTDSATPITRNDEARIWAGPSLLFNGDHYGDH
ncbi:hypothetical protein BGZ70_002951 [Mortierella alpina]|uniref:Ferritin-like domain-containing protein n=1 Tax=Mortierella alpina TaxID=64518 RepID=A0A9P6IV06_MORAP|nr:hypothetical protein BGZ70_002951 [Mortierella alpina]